MGLIEWQWVHVTAASAERRRLNGHAHTPPGNYTAEVVRQHLSAYCGCCYMVAFVQMIEDRLHISESSRQGRTVARERLDLQRAIDEYTTEGKSNFRENIREGVNLGAVSTYSNWNACMGGDPSLLKRALLQGSFKIHVGSTEYKGMTCAARAYGDAPFVSLRDPQGSTDAVDIEDPSCVDSLKRIIIARGPVVVAIDSSLLTRPGFDGTVRSGGAAEKRDHVVCVVGWLRREGMNVWLCRNSWGDSDTVRMPGRPQDIQNCVRELCDDSASKSQCGAQSWTWGGLKDSSGYLFINAEFDANACGIYGYPNGWTEVDVVLPARP